MPDRLPSQLHKEIERHAGRPESLIHVLRCVQDAVGFISPESEALVADRLGVPISRIHGVVTFFHLFYTSPRGKHIVRLCTGTACHVGSADRILTALQSHLGVAPGETTEDLAVTLETVACLGACALSPVMVVDDVYHGLLTPDEAVAIVDRTLEEAG
ncbi:NAD(P)H-dependent oxidoreductase subunit E [Candidatus Bipolaricaulota bacterium]|nr:NAD(P)H-dependent oxidoreductase subunit E [Candidatus Bipolaricaulota bacterium]